MTKKPDQENDCSDDKKDKATKRLEDLKNSNTRTEANRNNERIYNAMEKKKQSNS